MSFKEGSASKLSNYLLALIIVASGILLGVTYNYILFPLAWVCYVPLFYVVLAYKFSPLKSFLSGFCAATIHGLIVLSWIIGTTSRYAGSQSVLGYIFSFAGALIFAIKTGFPFFIFSHLMSWYGNKNTLGKTIVLLGTASVFVISDWIFSVIFTDIPWMFHFLGYTQSTNLYFSQLAELGGVWLITFILIFLNLLFTVSLHEKSNKIFFSGVSLIILIHAYGFIRYAAVEVNGKKHLKIALVCDNTEPEIRWNKQYVNQYVHTLFKLNKEAVSHYPDLIIWNEGSIPWSFSEDDDFLKEVLKQTRPYGSHQLLSYFTYAGRDSGSSYNSAYLLDSTGKIEGRYDKCKLLGGLEKPLWNCKALQLPFLTLKNTDIEGTHLSPIESKDISKVGVLICNESLTDIPSAALAHSNAGFLTLMANDNWFSKTQLAAHHFYITRFRAIETRKDIAINANMGYSGLIASNGDIKELSTEMSPKVLYFDVNTNKNASSFELRKEIFIGAMFLTFIISLIKRKEKT
jgi:apolipoprotein N-acyltransferase